MQIRPVLKDFECRSLVYHFTYKNIPITFLKYFVSQDTKFFEPTLAINVLSEFTLILKICW